MAKFIVQGGYPLQGEVSLLGAKNAAIKLLIASLLTSEKCQLSRLPDIGDVRTTLAILQALGGRIEETGDHQKCLDNQRLNSFKIPRDLGEQSRSASMFVGPLVARFGQAEWPVPGGCQIGQRPIDRHLAGLEKMGIKIQFKHGAYFARAEKLVGVKYRFPKNTHTGTETLIMAAVLAEGKTVLENAAQEPEVDDLILFLNKMGARIKRTRPRTIVIQGVKSLVGAEHKLMFDRNEAVTFACAALATKGAVVIKGINPSPLNAFLEKLQAAGAGVEIKENAMRFSYQKSLKAIAVTTAPHPGFMTDWQPLWAVLMTQAQGEAMIHETVFENRFAYAPFLEKMGVKIDFFNPPVTDPTRVYNFNPEDDRSENFHALRFRGPVALRPARISVPDIRAGATLVLAALAAQGQTTLNHIEHIDRGYEKLDVRLRSLGARIQRV